MQANVSAVQARWLQEKPLAHERCIKLLGTSYTQIHQKCVSIPTYLLRGSQLFLDKVLGHVPDLHDVGEDLTILPATIVACGVYSGGEL